MEIIIAVFLVSALMFKVGSEVEGFKRRRAYLRRQSRAFKNNLKMEASIIGMILVGLFLAGVLLIAVGG